MSGSVPPPAGEAPDREALAGEALAGEALHGGGTQAGGMTHFDEGGRARMVDLRGKPVTERTARACCRVLVSSETAARLAAGNLPKGDALTVARIAGIQAAKHTSNLIPLCHPVALDSVDVDVEVDTASGVVEVSSEARATDRTGVEMEALVAASVAALAIYDMVKSVEREARITDISVLEKAGGTSGVWRARR